MAPFLVSVTSTATIVLGNSETDPLQFGDVVSGDSKSGGSGEYRVSVNKVNWNWTFFFNSTDIALASFRNIALPHKSSRSDVNWWYLHFRNAQAARAASRAVQHDSNNGFTTKNQNFL